MLNILIQPADYAFSIWGAIYLGVLGLAVTQAFPSGDCNPRYVQARLSLIFNMLVNFCWFVATQREWGGVSAGLLWAQFGTAVWLYHALEIPGTKVFGLERLLRVSVRLYVGWLTVANVVTTAYVLERVSWNGWGVNDVAWAVVMLVVASAIGLSARFAWRDPDLWRTSAELVALRPGKGFASSRTSAAG